MTTGAHIILTTPGARKWASACGIVKAIDNTDMLALAPPDAVRIHRHAWDTQALDDPAARAGFILGSLHGYRHPLLYVEVFNEFKGYLVNDQGNSEGFDEHCSFLSKIVPILHQGGVKVCGPNWGSGAYGQPEWDYLRSTKPRRFCGLDAVSLHAYWSHQVGPTIYNAYRYRTYWRPGDPPILITECGIDQVRDGPNGTLVGKPGWAHPDNNCSQEQARATMVEFASEIAKDSYVLGATFFTAGPTDR